MDASEQAEFDRKSRQRDGNEAGGSTPRPDPTVLTTEALLREIAALRTLIDQRINATEALFDTKIMLGREGGMALKELFASQMADLREVLNERYQTQTKALDAAFVAQQAAVATSFDASEKAMAAALLAAKEAVEKANLATEKRFDGVQELLQQQNQTLSLLLPRAEAESRIGDLDRRVTEVKSTIDKGFTGTDMRHEMGAQHWGYLVGGLGLLAAVLVPIIVVIMTRSP